MNWDILDEDFTDLTDWTNQDFDTAVSEIDPAGQLRLDTNTGAAGNAYAQQYQDIGAYPDTFTAQIEVYHDLIGTYGSNDHFRIDLRQSGERFVFCFGTNGLFAKDDGGDTEVGTDLVKSGGSAERQIWRFLITCAGCGIATCDVYLFDSTHNYEKVGSAIGCSTIGSFVQGATVIKQNGHTTNDVVSHVYYAKILTGHYAVYPADLAMCLDTSHITQDGIRLDRASNGDVRSQILYDVDRKDFTLVHKMISDADKTTLDNFYTTNKALDFTLPWIDDVGYNCIFAGAPRYTLRGCSRYDVVVPLVQKDA